jgi:ABC-type cobalamin/Fe3+-siderophores transport system ATPase subunit
MLLEFKEVEVLYNNFILALRRVSIDVPEGGIVSILGANGAGKSTILKAISGILALENGKISKGNIFFEGKRIDDEHFERLGVHASIYRCDVSFADAVAWMRQVQGEFSIIGQEKQSLTGEIQTPHRVNHLPLFWQ